MANKEYNAFNEFENEVKNNVPKILPNALQELKEPLTEYINSQSVTKDTVRQLETPNVGIDFDNTSNNMESTLTSQGNTQNRQRVLTKEMTGGKNMSFNNSQSVNNGNSFNYSNISNDVPYGNSSSNSSNSMWGFTDTAILLSIAVLIALVFLVSTAAIMYFGLK